MENYEFFKVKNYKKLSHDFAVLWLKKFYPRRKSTVVVDSFYEVDTLAVYYNRKIDGYDSNHFEYSYILDFMKDAGYPIELEKTE